MANHNRLFQKSYYYAKWARGSTYSQYKGHQVGPHWKSDATIETCKGRELFFFSLLSRVSRAALQTVVQANPPKEHSQLAIYTIVTSVGARLNLFTFFDVFIVMLTIVSTGPTSKNRAVFTRHYITGILFRQIEVTFDLN